MSDEPLYGMARGRALLTETEREQIAGEHGDQRKYEAVSRVRARIREELTKDMKLFECHKSELVQEIQEVVCPEGRRIYCPICGEEFDLPSNAVHHLTGATQHDLSVEEVQNRIPKWWREEQENLSQYLGEENTNE